MPNSEIKINPEALEILNKIKSGEYIKVVKAKIAPFRWYILGAGILILLLLAISIGRSISRRANRVYAPPIIDITTTPTISQKASVFGSLKRSIQDFSTSLPDPAIPFYDNTINLEKTLY